jgi:DNA ligase (NAD+)
MNIDSLGGQTAQMLHDAGFVNTIADLYALKREQLLTLTNFKDKKADKLLAELEASKTCVLAAFVFAIGIPNVGAKTAKDLARVFGSFERLQAAGFEELTAINDVGDIVAQSILDFFTNELMRVQIETLFARGIKPKGAEKSETEAKLAVLEGKKFVLTGTLPNLDRKAANDLIERHGGSCAGSVSAKTDFVLAGESAGSKLDKARSLGIPILSEEAFLRLIGETI